MSEGSVKLRDKKLWKNPVIIFAVIEFFVFLVIFYLKFSR